MALETYFLVYYRYLTEGGDGLLPRTRAPYRSPGQIDVDLEIQICKTRKTTVPGEPA